MSVPKRVTKKCVVCQAESMQIILLSSSSFSAPDLDLRPASMARNTMQWWIQKCPKCGYVAKDIAAECPSVQDVMDTIKSDAYQSCDGRCPMPKLAQDFYRQFLLATKAKDAFWALLHAAWECDDYGDEENARYCRSLALEKLNLVIEQAKNKEELQVVRMDLLRRTANFDMLIQEYQGKRFSDDTLNQIAAFQLDRARSRDTACYTVTDAMNANLYRKPASDDSNTCPRCGGRLKGIFVKRCVKCGNKLNS